MFCGGESDIDVTLWYKYVVRLPAIFSGSDRVRGRFNPCHMASQTGCFSYIRGATFAFLLLKVRRGQEKFFHETEQCSKRVLPCELGCGLR